jgi:Glycosyl transferase family 11
MAGNRMPKPTVRVRVVGGLGNQMFCAAAGMALARRLGAELEFGLDKINRLKHRNYELGVFGLKARIVEGESWKFSRSWAPYHRLMGLFGPETTIWRQQGHHFDPAFLELGGNVMLRGFFQSAKYFDAISDEVRSSFDLVPHLTERGRELAKASAGEATVALHIRRGDYVSVASNAEIFATLGADYYRRALEIVARDIARPRLIVVSDDIAAARQLLADHPDATYAEETSLIDDMHLIGACRHRIIANSSFSWWGAYLGPRQSGVTVAPRQWFAGEMAQRTRMDDMFPGTWQLT